MKKVTVRRRYDGFTQMSHWGVGGITPPYCVLCDSNFEPSCFNEMWSFCNTSLNKWIRRRDNHVVLVERSDMRHIEELVNSYRGNKTRRFTLWMVQRQVFNVARDAWEANPAFNRLFPEAVAQEKIRKSLLKKNKYHSKPLPLP